MYVPQLCFLFCIFFGFIFCTTPDSVTGVTSDAGTPPTYSFTALNNPSEITFTWTIAGTYPTLTGNDYYNLQIG